MASYVDLPMSKKEEDLRPRPSSYARASFALFLTTVIDLAAALATDHWATWQNNKTGAFGRYGLWKQWSCTKVETSNGEERTDTVTVCDAVNVGRSFPSWYLATDILMSAAMVGVAICLIITSLYVFCSRCQRNRTFITVMIGAGFMAGTCMMAGLALFGSKIMKQGSGEKEATYTWVLSWSFTLACTAFLLNIIGTSLMLTERKRLGDARREMLRVQMVTSGPSAIPGHKYETLRLRTTST